jgi:hypothetical protein
VAQFVRTRNPDIAVVSQASFRDNPPARMHQAIARVDDVIDGIYFSYPSPQTEIRANTVHRQTCGRFLIFFASQELSRRRSVGRVEAIQVAEAARVAMRLPYRRARVRCDISSRGGRFASNFQRRDRSPAPRFSDVGLSVGSSSCKIRSAPLLAPHSSARMIEETDDAVGARFYLGLRSPPRREQGGDSQCGGPCSGNRQF